MPLFFIRFKKRSPSHRAFIHFDFWAKFLLLRKIFTSNSSLKKKEKNRTSRNRFSFLQNHSNRFTSKIGKNSRNSRDAVESDFHWYSIPVTACHQVFTNDCTPSNLLFISWSNWLPFAAINLDALESFIPTEFSISWKIELLFFFLNRDFVQIFKKFGFQFYSFSRTHDEISIFSRTEIIKNANRCISFG